MSEDMKTDDSYIDLWLSFYDAVAIDERKNEKLRMQNMPKKYWKHLPEMNRLLQKHWHPSSFDLPHCQLLLQEK